MSKSVLISIRPQWCDLIASGKKTIEVRKTRPKLETPFKCYIYCTSVKNMSPQEYLNMHKKTNGFINKWNAKVIGEFVCDNIDRYTDEVVNSSSLEDFCRWNDFDLNRACIHPDDLEKYADGNDLYGWHISKLVIYAKPKALTDFKGRKLVWCGNNHVHTYEQIKRPPQSWCYVEDLK